MPINQSIPSNEFDYKKLRSEIFLRYGIELDETTLSVLYILQTETTAELRKMKQSIDHAMYKINTSCSSLQVDYHHPRWQAFWFGMGKLGLAIIFLITVLSVWGIVYSCQQQNNEKVEQERQWYKAYYNESQTDNPKDLKRFLKIHSKPEDD